MEVIRKIVVVIIKPQQTVALLAVFISILIRLLTHLFSHRYIGNCRGCKEREKRDGGWRGEKERGGEIPMSIPAFCFALCFLNRILSAAEQAEPRK